MTTASRDIQITPARGKVRFEYMATPRGADAEVDFDAVLDLQAARALREWLDGTIEQMMRAENSAAPSPTNEAGDVPTLVVTAARLVEAIAQALPIDEEAESQLRLCTEEVVARQQTRPLKRR